MAYCHQNTHKIEIVFLIQMRNIKVKMVLSIAQGYFKTAFNSRSIVEGDISNSH